MAQQDKTDWYWNGELAGAVNNLYYDFINVDVCHVPYATQNRNSSFFLKTRLWYQPEKNREDTLWARGKDWDITDVHIVWDEKCNNSSWKLYLLARNKDGWQTKKRIFTAPIENGCVWTFNDIVHHAFITNVTWCWDWKFLVTDYVKWESIDGTNALKSFSESAIPRSWIQINKIAWGITIWQFTDKNIEAGYTEWDGNKVKQGMYLLVYDSKNVEWSWHLWQVNMVTGISDDWKTLELYSPWLWFKVPTDWEPVEGRDLKYKFFSEWWEVVWFTDWKKIQLITDYENDVLTTVYTQDGTTAADKTNIIWVASANDKIFILTDNWYIQYSSEWKWWWNKFFIQDSMFAWLDKIAITAYRDMVLAFGRKHIAIWVPDEQNNIWTMYNQSTTVWLWSRYSFAEYEWDLVFVSNDRRLLMLEIASTWRYWLDMNDVWSSMMINWKLSTLVEWDEVYIWSDNNDLRIFVNTKPTPYKTSQENVIINDVNNTLTHIYKFNTLFKVWTEDYITNFLLWWSKQGIYLWQYWIYVKWWGIWTKAHQDISATIYNPSWRVTPVTTTINAYLMENESDWTWANNSWLSNRPKLHNLAKLNRLITVLWPGIYSTDSKIKITAYSKWIWYTYEFPVSWDWNDWIWLITNYYLNEQLSEDEREKLECMLSTLQDSQKQYQPNCSDWDVYRQYMRQEKPWCSNYTELLTGDYWICVNDKIYELSPTMPLVTDLWENQQYSTQIKLELIWWKWDVICFGWWLAELFIAPLFQKWPDWEYQLQPNTDCD